jgi:hypothetical protein
MLQFDAAPVETSNPLSVNVKQSLSRNREMLAICATGLRGIAVGAGASEQNVRLAAPCDRASRYHDRKGPQLGRPVMRKLMATTAFLILVGTSVAMAQTVGSRNPAAPQSASPDKQMLPEAPVGHRQPRADQAPSEKDLMDPKDPINQENAALDRMINSICRGC